MKGVIGSLPGGYWDATNLLHREFELAVLTGREEELLLQVQGQEVAALVTTVLSHCVQRLGNISPVSEAVARQLLVADRHYLLLKLRQAAFGDHVRVNLFCPWRDCGQQVSIAFAIDDIPVVEMAERAPFYTLMLSPAACAEQGAAGYEVSFRLPNGADQEAVSPLLAANEAQALTLLLARCIQSLDAQAAPTVEQVAALPALARAEIEAAMAHLAPKVETNIEVRCAECGRAFVAPFDLQRFFFGELRTDRDLLYREVHYLAYHYHWSEHEIMEMSRTKRRQYIDVLADEIERLNHGG